MPDDKKAHKASAATLAHIDELLDEALKHFLRVIQSPSISNAHQT
jgi:hypothetical protein